MISRNKKVPVSKEIVITSNSCWSIVNFRCRLIEELIALGFRVTVVAPIDQSSSQLERMGAHYIDIKLDRKGTNLFKDLIYLLKLLMIYRRLRPALNIAYTVKPVIYSCLAASVFKVSSISVITGLGSSLLSGGLIERFVCFLYRLSQRGSKVVVFLNIDDKEYFQSRKLIKDVPSVVIPGEGVSTDHFSPSFAALSFHDGARFKKFNRFVFIFIGRVLKDKGIYEYIEAARRLKQYRKNADFYIAGFIGADNPTAVLSGEMREWVESGVVKFLGPLNDVRGALLIADCFVLPSYREGLPRGLMEASAMELCVIATDVPGCRDVVDDGVTGYLCMPRDACDLETKMNQILDMSQADRSLMGKNGRRKMLESFDETHVVSRYVSLIVNVLEERSTH